MIEKEYFEDAFILHDETYHYLSLKFLHTSAQKSSHLPIEFVFENFFTLESERDSDKRLLLFNKWGKFANIFRRQPIHEIKNYFGESNAIYFAWLGVFISLLWFPSLMGFIFFIAGLGLKYIIIFHSLLFDEIFI